MENGRSEDREGVMDLELGWGFNDGVDRIAELCFLCMALDLIEEIAYGFQ